MKLQNTLLYLISIILLVNLIIASDSDVISNESTIVKEVTVSDTDAVSNESIIVNDKFSFVKEIYSDSWALIIGINKYQNVDRLDYAVDDAKSVKNILTDKYGFKEDNILFITDEEATKDRIMQGFQDILLSAGKQDRVVVFYAGHGDTYPLPSGGDMGYLIPVDGYNSKDKIFLSSIAMSTIEQLADMSEAKHILYLVDACYGGLTLNTRGLSKEQTPEYLRRMTREKGRQVITAGGKDEQVIEKPEWGHSAFTRNLIKGLGDGLADENMDGIITADELGGFIKNRVVVDVDGRHTPQKGRIGSDMGEFVFISQTLDEQFADFGPADEKLSDMVSEMANIKRLLKLQSQERGSDGVSAIDKSVQMEKASKLSWFFPGAGHFVAGNKGKGLFFSSLELAALAGVAVFGGTYSTKVDEYNSAKIALDEYEANYSGGENEYPIYKERAVTAFDAQKQAQNGLIGCGTVAGVVWLWNIIDAKKFKSDSYSDNNRFSMGINQKGQVEAQISF